MRKNRYVSSSHRPVARRRLANRRLAPEAAQDAPSARRPWAILKPFRWLNEKRIQCVSCFFAAIWVLLLCRAFQVQIILGPTYRDMAEDQHTHTEVVEGKRGSIYDRNGRVLARSVSCQSVYADPRLIQDFQDAADRLAPILRKKPEDLVRMFQRKKSFIWLQRKVDDATAAAIDKEHVPGIFFKLEYERVYPYRNLAGQLLGFVDMDQHGLEGIERAFDDVLRGGKVSKKITRNIVDQVLKEEDKATESHGTDITLSIDGQVQFIAESELSKAVDASGAKWGGVLVSDVATGQILAWAQYPFFNPNNYRKASSATYRNRLAGDSLEPGSTFTPLLMAAALEEKIVPPDTSVYCEKGLWNTRYARIRDDTHFFGNLTATEIISHSSNIGSAKIGLKLGATRFHSYLSRLGFGQKTGVGVHETRGIMRRTRDWSEVDLMSTSFGQSISVTGVQMLQAYTTLAAGGIARPLTLRLDAGSETPKNGVRIFSEKTSREVLKMMEEVVDGNGTGSKARIPGLRVAGKTGTAQKAARAGKGYSHKRLASFGGIVPADSPRYVIYVMLDEPSTTGYGGAIAAPVFQKVATRTLAYSGFLPDVTFAMENGAKKSQPAKKLTRAQLAQQKKDEIYLANREKYRQEKERRQLEKSGAAKKEERKVAGAMPDLCGLTLRKSMEACAQLGIIPSVKGSGAVVVRQSPPAGSKFHKDTSFTVWLADKPKKSDIVTASKDQP